MVVSIVAKSSLRGLTALLFAAGLNTSLTAAEGAAKGTDYVRVVADQMHQLEVVKVVSHAFLDQRSAIGQIAFNEDASTIVLTPFSGRVPASLPMSAMKSKAIPCWKSIARSR
jgi:cobalt-zinc-cadmium efflux system membrane fusion protein